MCVCVQQLDGWAELCVCGCCREGKGQLQLQPLRPHNVQEAKTETEAAKKTRERDKTVAQKRIEREEKCNGNNNEEGEWKRGGRGRTTSTQ